MIDCITLERWSFEASPFASRLAPTARAARVRRQVHRTRCLTCRGRAKRMQSCHPACCIDCPSTRSNPLRPGIDATSRSRRLLPDSTRSGLVGQQARPGCVDCVDSPSGPISALESLSSSGLRPFAPAHARKMEVRACPRGLERCSSTPNPCSFWHGYLHVWPFAGVISSPTFV